MFLMFEKGIEQSSPPYSRCTPFAATAQGLATVRADCLTRLPDKHQILTSQNQWPDLGGGLVFNYDCPLL